MHNTNIYTALARFWWGWGCPIPSAAAERDAMSSCAEVSPLEGGFLFGLGFSRGAESFWKGSEFALSWVQLLSGSSRSVLSGLIQQLL